MFKKIVIILISILLVIAGIVFYNLIKIEKINKEYHSAIKNKIEKGKVILNKDEVTGAIQYKSNTLYIEINPIKKTNPNLEMWEVNVKINEGAQIKSAFANDIFNLKSKEKTSSIAIRKKAILAINGAAAGFNKKSYVIRDGIVYRDTKLVYDPLVIKRDGNFKIYDDNLTGEELINNGAMHAYDFGPDLIRNGEIVDYGNEWYKTDLAPRTVIGQKGTLEYVILIIDGRSEKSVGMSNYGTAVELKNRGCYVGYNLDGGGSTTLFFNGEVLNNPSDGGERIISDILYFID